MPGHQGQAPKEVVKELISSFLLVSVENVRFDVLKRETEEASKSRAPLIKKSRRNSRRGSTKASAKE